RDLVVGHAAEVVQYEEVLSAERPVDIVELDDAIERFGKIDERKSDILVLHYFGGMTHDEIAEALDISAATVDRELRFARAWLGNELKDD
ncbi:MAG: antiterminator Q family protein, partial [Pseudomonadota bacterium]